MNGQIKTVTEQIYQEIREAIITHEIAPGEKLTIKMLHEKYGVSSSPIREALTRLQQDGLIVYKPNIGMRTVSMTQKDINEIYDMIIELDSAAMRFAMRSKDADKCLDEVRAVQEAMAAEQNFDRWKSLSDDFHQIFYKYADNSRLIDASRRILLQLTILSSEYEQDAENRREILEGHRLILEALTKNNLQEADQLLRQHLESSRRKALALLK